MKKTHSICLAVFLTLTACEETSNQKPKDIFADRTQFPAELQKRANPTPLGSVDSYMKNSPRENVIRVGVVDSGIDYNNPAVFYQTDLRVESGKFTGAGVDFLGEDNWGHPNLIQADLFAFMANDVKGRKIVGAVEDPVNRMFAINSELVSNLKKEINANELLKNSIFAAKVNTKSVNFLITRSLLKEPFDQKLYDQKKKETPGLANLENTKPGGANEKEFDFNEEWDFGIAPDISRFVLSFRRIEHADLMYAIVQKVHQNLDAKYQLEKKFLQLAQFNSVNVNDESAMDSLAGKLNDLLSAFTNQFRNTSPINKMLRTYCKIMEPQYLFSAEVGNGNGYIKDERVLQIKDKFFSDMNEYLGALRSAYQTEEDNKARIEQAIADLPKLRKHFDQIVKRYGANIFNCSPRSFRTQDVHHEKLERSNTHPFLDPSSPSSSHGTHVAGIIALQSPRIKVVPMRVTTQGMETSQSMDDELKNEFKRDFAQWAQIPVVKEAFQNRWNEISIGLGNSSFLGAVDSYLSDNFATAKLQFEFFREIKQAIKYLGENKIKIANLSLGLNYEAPVASVNISDKNRRQQAFKYLMNEFFKFSVAETMTKYASKTLFVIASGNDGKWLDGKSRSGLPCDLSSTELKKTEAGKKLANNQIQNILCVGSINPKDEISSFSNIPLTDVPFVFGYGEDILSSVQSNNCEGNIQDLAVEFKDGLTYTLPSAYSKKDVLKPVWDRIGWTKQTESKKYEASDIALLMSDLGEDVLTGMGKVISNESCAERPKKFARMSGTSMATPAVAGFIARALVAISYEKKISEMEIYDSPDFAPKTIIAQLKSRSPQFGGESIISSVAKVVKMKTWDKIIAQRATHPAMAAAAISNIQSAPVFNMIQNARIPNAQGSSDKNRPERQEQFWPAFEKKNAEFSRK